MAELIVVSKPISQSGNIFSHEFILYRDDFGDLSFVRGGPASRIFGSSGLGSQSGGITSSAASNAGGVTIPPLFGFGPIIIDYGPYEKGTPDHPGDPTAIGANGLPIGWASKVIATSNGKSALSDQIGQQFVRMAALATSIHNAKISYDPVEQNSNSVVGTLLRSEGYDPPNSYFIPAAQTDLRTFLSPASQMPITAPTGLLDPQQLQELNQQIPPAFDPGGVQPIDAPASPYDQNQIGQISFIPLPGSYVDPFNLYTPTAQDPNNYGYSWLSLDPNGSGFLYGGYSSPYSDPTDTSWMTIGSSYPDLYNAIGTIDQPAWSLINQNDPNSYQPIDPALWNVPDIPDIKFDSPILTEQPGRPSNPNPPPTPSTPENPNGFGFSFWFNDGGWGFFFFFTIFFPVVLDLDGDGVKIDPLSSSTKTFDMFGDGQQHLTAWAGKGDGVLAIDANGDGKIDRREEVVFTAWDPSAKTDFDALRSVFDTNHDGQLTAADERFNQFRLVVDGQVKTLADLGIVAISLVSNRAQFVFSDGSQINGTATFTRANGTTGTAADTALASDANGGVVSTTTTTNADKSVTLKLELRDPNGQLISSRTKTTTANGFNDTLLFDDDGDGVTDRKQTIARAKAANGTSTETVTEFDRDGRKIASSVTTYNGNGTFASLKTDRDGDGKFETSESLSTDAAGNSTTLFVALNPNGTTASTTKQNVTKDSLTTTTSVDQNGDGQYETVTTDKIVPATVGARTETVTTRSGTNKVLAQKVTATSEDGYTKAIFTDSDGDGLFERIESVITQRLANGEILTTDVTSSADGSARVMTKTHISADGLTTITEIDADGDGLTDETDSTLRYTDTDGSVVTRTERRTQDGVVFSQEGSNTGVDKRNVSRWSDNANGWFGHIDDRTSVDANGQITEIINYSDVPNNQILNQRIITTSADGLSITTSDNLSAIGWHQYSTTDSTTIDPLSHLRTRTVTHYAMFGVNDKTVTKTSADGLSIEIDSDVNGDGSFDSIVTDVTSVTNGVKTETLTHKTGAAIVTDYTVSVTSADKQITTIKTYLDGDAQADRVELIEKLADGSTRDTTSVLSATGTEISKSISKKNSTGLRTEQATFLNGILVGEIIDETALTSNGNKTRTTKSYAGDYAATSTGVTGTLLSSVTAFASGNGALTKTSSDYNGDGIIDDIVQTETAQLRDGHTVTTISDLTGTGQLRSRSRKTNSHNGFESTVDTDFDGDEKWDRSVHDLTRRAANGDKITDETVTSADGHIIVRSITTQSGYGRSTAVATSLNGSAAPDRSETVERQADGTLIDIKTDYHSDGSTKSVEKITTSADALTTTISFDHDGNGMPDETIIDAFVWNLDGSKTETITRDGTSFTGDASNRSVTTITRSDNGFWESRIWDNEGDGTNDTFEDVLTTIDATSGAISKTDTLRNAAGAILIRSTETTSANGRIKSIGRITKSGGTADDQLVTITVDAAGTKTETDLDLDGNQTVIGKRIITTSADGLTETTQFFADGISLNETIRDTTTIASNGTKTIIHERHDGGVTGALRDQVQTVVSGHGLSKVISWDLDTTNDGAGVTYERVRSEIRSLTSDGRAIVITEERNGSGALLSRSTVTTSANGKVVIEVDDVDGDNIVDLTTTTKTLANTDGSTSSDLSIVDGNGQFVRHVTTATSADGRHTAITRYADASGTVEMTETIDQRNSLNGQVEVDHQRFSGNRLIDRVQTLQSADGHASRVAIDADGDGKIDQIRMIVQHIDGSTVETRTDFDPDLLPVN